MEFDSRHHTCQHCPGDPQGYGDPQHLCSWIDQVSRYTGTYVWRAHVLGWRIRRWVRMRHAPSPTCALLSGHEENTAVYLSIDQNTKQTRRACAFYTRLFLPSQRRARRRRYFSTISFTWTLCREFRQKKERVGWVHAHPLLQNNQNHNTTAWGNDARLKWLLLIDYYRTFETNHITSRTNYIFGWR